MKPVKLADNTSHGGAQAFHCVALVTGAISIQVA